mmetsp:Transcript_7193/g.10041  ORF Transcript_7193/g.10041 Transcript_7193/m.10041 type:complete len:81 (-) Transcript_7193:2061-2303(-)
MAANVERLVRSLLLSLTLASNVFLELLLAQVLHGDLVGHRTSLAVSVPVIVQVLLGECAACTLHLHLVCHRLQRRAGAAR